MKLSQYITEIEKLLPELKSLAEKHNDLTIEFDYNNCSFWKDNIYAGGIDYESWEMEVEKCLNTPQEIQISVGDSINFGDKVG